MVQVGFEPTPPKRLELESSALDRSATKPSREKHYFNKIIGVFDKNLKKMVNMGIEPMTLGLLDQCSTI